MTNYYIGLSDMSGGPIMLYNPFILKRENLLEKQAINQNFDTSLLIKSEQLENRLDKLKEELIEDLHNILHHSNDHTILDAIRFLRNNKFDKFVEGIQELDFDSERINRNMADFGSSYERYNQIMKDAKERYEADRQKVRENYQYVLRENTFLTKGLLMINPKVYYKLKSYLNTPINEHKSKQRKLEGTLHNFIHRAAYKTSPFSNITNVGRIEFGSDKDNHISRDHKKTVSLNFTFIYHLTHHYMSRSDYFKENVKYTIPPFSITSKDGNYYIEFLAKDDSSKRTKVFLSDEKLGKLKIPNALVELFNKRKMISFSDLLNALRTRVEKGKVYYLIDNFTKIGLLVPAIGFDERSSEHLIRDVKRKLSNLLEHDYYTELVRFLDEAYCLSIKVSSATDMEQMHKYLRKLDSVLQEINEKTNVRFTPNQVFYEDGYFIDTETNKENTIIPFLDPLEKIQTFSLIFDNSIRLRLEFAERLRKITTNHTDLDMGSDFFSVLFNVSKDMINYWKNPIYMATDIFISEQLKELDHLKSNFLSDLKELCEESSDCSIDIKDLMHTYVEKIPADLKRETDLSSSIFAQFHQDKMIINSMYEGQEKYLARFMNFFNDFLDNDHQYRKFIEAFYDYNNYYDLTDTYGFNGNVKKQRLSRECYTSGIGTRRFTKEAYESLRKLEDFTINTESSQIKFMDPDGKEAKVCFRGSLTPVYMPGYIATVLQMFNSGAMYFKMSEIIDGDFVPRIIYDNVIISRGSVRLSAIKDEVKKRDGEDDFSYFKRMNAVFCRMDLYKEFFAVVDQSIQMDNEDLYKFKPLYINMENPLSLKVFEKEVINKFDESDYNLLFMEEYLSNDGQYAKEYNFEIYNNYSSCPFN